ncbi:MAG TPA: malate synthase A [Jiangellaceae bacterium]|nr:malate synthase A [Jiangellaceae bacterium]
MITVHAAPHPEFDAILSPAALGFVADLHRCFAGRRAELLNTRRQKEARAFDFLPETETVRSDPTWRIAPPAPGLQDRRCEITGPPTPSMTVNALNSRARVWMADFEDAMSPTWVNLIDGQLNLYHAIRRSIDFTDERGRRYELRDQTATIMVRPRGLHLCEKHLRIDGQPIPGAFVDFGLFLFHNAHALIDSGRGPYFYLPKLESHLEARLWNNIFTWAEQVLALRHGTIRATCLVETFPAAFEMEEILYELREHSAGLNAGRWDYLFSYIKSFADDPAKVLPDRAAVTMTVPMMQAYCQQLVRVCHARGAHAIGGMAAFVPDRSSADITEEALARTEADKRREADLGFDGSWVAHPALVQTCSYIFTETLGNLPNQIGLQHDLPEITANDLMGTAVPGDITLRGVRNNVQVSLRYLTAWVGGRGAVTINHLMEDAATVEISRMQIWQWIRHGAQTAGGATITAPLVTSMIAEEAERMLDAADPSERNRIIAAADILRHSCLEPKFPSFFTGYGYSYLIEGDGALD